jgi:hypothetical protein
MRDHAADRGKFSVKLSAPSTASTPSTPIHRVGRLAEQRLLPRELNRAIVRPMDGDLVPGLSP